MLQALGDLLHLLQTASLACSHHESRSLIAQLGPGPEEGPELLKVIPHQHRLHALEVVLQELIKLDRLRLR
jgi:hypothetical protein